MKDKLMSNHRLMDFIKYLSPLNSDNYTYQIVCNRNKHIRIKIFSKKADYNYSVLHLYPEDKTFEYKVGLNTYNDITYLEKADFENLVKINDFANTLVGILNALYKIRKRND